MVITKDIKLVVFDFDGTLFHINIDWVSLRKKIGLSATDNIGEYLKSGNPVSEIITQEELDSVQGKVLDPSIKSMLAELNNIGLDTAILTRNSRRAVEEVLTRSGISHITIVGREDVKLLKPDPEGLSKILAEKGVEPSQTMVVGDTYHDVDTAKSLGAQSVIVSNPLLEYAPKGADVYLDAVTDLI